MFKILKNKIVDFLGADIRWKLKKLKKFSGINFYPSYFHKNLIRGLYSKLIFRMIFNEKAKEIKKKNYNLIFKDSKFNNKVNLLASLPRSGSNYLRNLINSYVELYYQIGNGVPKYDASSQKWNFVASTIIQDDMYTSVSFDNKNFNIITLLSKEDFERKKIVFTRYPFVNLELYKLNFTKPVILLRNPEAVLTSWYVTQATRFHRSDSSKINYKFLNGILESYEKFILYWKEFAKKQKKDKDYLIIKYEELVKNTEDRLIKILKFYNYEIDISLITKSVSINLKENYIKYMGTEINKTRLIFRFSDKKIIRPELESYIRQYLEKKNTIKIYNSF